MPRSERPLDPGDTPLLRFAAELRRLRESAGSPVYRELSVKAHYSVAVLSEAAGGRKLPSLAVALAYVDACGGDVQEWERRWREVADSQESPAADDRGMPPYLGLSAFQVEDAGRFHGRGALLAHLSNHILNRRLVVVFGASGAGKSSLLRAGLAATSLRDGVDGLGPQRTVVFTPGAHPVEECALWLSDLTGAPATELRAELRADPTALHLWLRQALVGDTREAVVIVDQFEEVFTLCADEDERLAFITALLHLADAPTSVARLVLGVRADFFGHCLQYPQLRQILGEGPVLVGAMTADELRLAITKPAIDLGYAVETALVTRLVSEATNQPGVLPLMSHALLETWRRRQGMTLTAAGYDSAGGISHALGRTAESVYTGLSPEQKSVARQVFLRLTALGDGTEDTRRHVSRAELDHVEGLDEVLIALVDARLVTVDQDGVDIAHEALISHWPRLREWLTEDRDGLRTQRQLTEAAEIWDSLNRDDGALYRGARLELAREWVSSCAPSLSHRERAYFDRSVEVCLLEAQAAKRRTRRLKQLVALLVVLSVALAGTTAYSLISQHTVAEQRDQSTTQNVIQQLPGIALQNPELAGELALAVYRLDPSPLTRGLVLASSANTRASRHPGIAWMPRSGQALSLTSTEAVFPADSSTGAMVGQLGDNESSSVIVPSPLKYPTLSGWIEAAALSPNGRLLAMSRRSHEYADDVELWDVSQPNDAKLLRTYQTDTSSDVAFSPDGRLLAITFGGQLGSDGKTFSNVDLTTRLWDTANPAATTPVAVLPDTVEATVFSPDGGELISKPVHASYRNREVKPGSPADTVGPWQIWNVRDALSGQVSKSLETKAFGAADTVSPSPDGKTLIVGHSAAGSGSVQLWTWSGDSMAKTAELPTGVAPQLPVFGPDGRTVAWIEGDNTVVVWDVSDPTAPIHTATLAGRTSGAKLVRFTSDGQVTVIESGYVLTRGLNPESAAAKICAAVKKPSVPRDKWVAWGSFFPSMDVPEPCPR